MSQRLINGMALGLRHETPDDIEEPFQQTGTLHLFAVAGLHVGIVAQLLWILALLLRLPRKVAAGLIIPCLFFYSAITGFHVSSVRAATMAAVLFGGIFFDRPALALNSLAGAALLILAVDPNQLFSSGFQLSFAVVGAILISQQWIYRILLRPSESDPFLPRSLVSRGRRLFENAYGWMAGAHLNFHRRLDGIVSPDYVVFLFRHADFASREFGRCPSRFLRPGGRAHVIGRGAFFRFPFARF